MRARDRRTVERRARALAPTARVVWCRDLPDRTFATAHYYTASESWICISEREWERSSAAERADTLAHECAHVLAWTRHGTEIAPHGREWRRIFRSLTTSLS